MAIHKPYGIYEKFFKRVFDIICALMAFLLFGWLYIIVAVLVRIKLGSPVIFKQQRPGKIDPETGKEKLFYLYKFRSMSNAVNKNGELLPDSQRLTKFGKILRKLSLDELPEAWNILKGDMSVIGPRPLVVSYLPYYTDEERKRHLVRPGLSGLAQVNGRNALQWEQRFAYDVEYINKITFIGDIKLIIMTVLKVFKRESVIVRGTGKTEDFNVYREKQREAAKK